MGGRGVGWVSIIWGVWVARAVPPRTCAHVGSVGALDTPKLCPVGLELPRGPSQRTGEDVLFRGETNCKWRQFEYKTREKNGCVEKNSLT